MLSSSDAVLHWQAAIFSLLIILVVLFLPRGVLVLVQSRARVQPAASCAVCAGVPDARDRPTTELVLAGRDASRALRRRHRRPGHQLRRAAGRDRRADRAERRRQDDAGQPDHRGVRARPRGTITFEGTRLNGLKPHAIGRMGIARTFQVVRPFANLTVLENVAVGAMYGAGGAQALGAARRWRRPTSVLELVHLAAAARRSGREPAHRRAQAAGAGQGAGDGAAPAAARRGDGRPARRRGRRGDGR